MSSATGPFEILHPYVFAPVIDDLSTDSWVSQAASHASGSGNSVDKASLVSEILEQRAWYLHSKHVFDEQEDLFLHGLQHEVRLLAVEHDIVFHADEALSNPSVEYSNGAASYADLKDPAHINFIARSLTRIVGHAIVALLGPTADGGLTMSEFMDAVGAKTGTSRDEKMQEAFAAISRIDKARGTRKEDFDDVAERVIAQAGEAAVRETEDIVQGGEDDEGDTRLHAAVEISQELKVPSEDLYET